MGFYFYGRYINTDADEKKVEQDMYVALSYFWSSDNHIGYEWRSNLEPFFSYFILTSEQKYYYVQMKLVGQAYWW